MSSSSLISVVKSRETGSKSHKPGGHLVFGEAEGVWGRHGEHINNQLDRMQLGVQLCVTK